MSIIEKIIDWRTEQLKQGHKPEQIALSPWDEEELMRWAEELAIYPVTQPRSERIILGMKIISSRIQN